MSTMPNQYRFTTEAQWNTGLVRRLAWVGDGLRVTPALATHAEPIGHERRTGPLAASPHGAVYWVEYPKTLTWRHRHLDQSGAIEVAPELADAQRLVVGRRWLWTHHGERAELHRFAMDTLTGPDRFRLRELLDAESRCDDLEIIDIAADGCDGLWLLVLNSRRPLQLVHVSDRGEFRSTRALPEFNGWPTAITAVTGEVAVVYGDTQRLLFVRTSDMAAAAELSFATLGADFQCTCLGGDGSNQVIVCGTIAGPHGRTTQINVLRRTASGVDNVATRALPAAGAEGARGAAYRKDELWVSTARGVWRYGPATQADPDEPQALYLTPVLTSPRSGSVSGWLRAELDVDLPLGTRVYLSYASTSDQSIHDSIVAACGGDDTSADQRIAQVNAALSNALTTTAIEFDGQANGNSRRTISIPLSRPMGNAPGNNIDLWMWVLIGISSGAAGPLPTLHSLRVLYPFASLMEHLPAIFRGEGQVNGFMLDLVGVLETTTQGLDAEIASLARVLDPRYAPLKWLDLLAGWLALPWDSSLNERQKRAILSAAPGLLAQRGTRAALVAILQCLFPGARVEIVDQAADVQQARVGDSQCPGAPLPAILAGWPAGLAVLGDKAVLSRTRLACGLPTEVADAPPLSKLCVDIFASLAEQRATPLTTVSALLTSVVPAECQICVRWRRISSVGPKVEADGTLVLDGPGPRYVSDNFELGYAVLAGREGATLDSAGLSAGERLR